jgi:putative Ca2+/H+ antiporter (TMEM165/GDT1 family)
MRTRLAPRIARQAAFRYIARPRQRIPAHAILDAFLISTGIVALAEIGDKTQLLALVLAARFKKPWPIIWGILVATLLNHALAGSAGAWAAAALGPETMRWILGLSFLAMGAWMLIPDKLDADATDTPKAPLGVFGATVVAFFLAEMADKTQIATIALAARFDTLAGVVLGTTLGMMIANVPAVLLGEIATQKIPARIVHTIAALIFAVLGAAVLWGPLPAWMPGR